jgi:hypothetical protein
VFENRMLRRICGSKREEVAGKYSIMSFVTYNFYET